MYRWVITKYRFFRMYFTTFLHLTKKLRLCVCHPDEMEYSLFSADEQNYSMEETPEDVTEAEHER